MSIYDLIEELENELSESKNILFSKRGVVDTQKCERLLAEIKRQLPAAIQEASYLLTQKDKIIGKAQDSADKIVKQAEAYAADMVSESEILKNAESRAALLTESAEKQFGLKEMALRKNIDKMLKGIEDYLLDNLHVVRNNREELAGTILIASKDKNKDK